MKPIVEKVHLKNSWKMVEEKNDSGELTVVVNYTAERTTHSKAGRVQSISYVHIVCRGRRGAGPLCLAVGAMLSGRK